MQFSLRSLFFLLTVCGIASYGIYVLRQPYAVVGRMEVGPNRYVELLRPGGFCDRAGLIHFRFSGMQYPKSPPEFAIWDCGSKPDLRVLRCEGDLVALVESSNEILILIDFKTGKSWPASSTRKVDPSAQAMLERMRRAHGELWLWDTYDGRLTKPRR